MLTVTISLVVIADGPFLRVEHLPFVPTVKAHPVCRYDCSESSNADVARKARLIGEQD